MKTNKTSVLEECPFKELLSPEAKTALQSVPVAWTELYIKAISAAAAGKPGLLSRIRVATALGSTCAPGIDMREIEIPAPTGTLKSVIFTPQKIAEKSAAVFFVHGGGWSISDAGTYTRICSAMAAQLGVPVILPDFRLGPENPFPAAADDLHAAAIWLFQNAQTLGIDSQKIFFAGDSAGGQLATCAALRLIDEKLPSPAGIMLFYPVTTFETVPAEPTGTLQRFDKGGLLSLDLFAAMKNAYVPAGTNHEKRYISPLETSLAGFPKTLIITAECDILRDDAERFAEKLRAEKIHVKTECIRGVPHAFMSTPGFEQTIAETLSLSAEFMSRA